MLSKLRFSKDVEKLQKSRKRNYHFIYAYYDVNAIYT
jgi:hypothetical protein